jgi:glutamate-1-semialdehyde aminotransferase
MRDELKKIYEQHVIKCIDNQCKNTKRNIDKHRNYFATNRHSAGFSDSWKQITFALCGQQASGAYIYDLDENKYLDIAMGFGVHLFGHSPSYIKEVINRQTERGISLGPIHPDAGETAHLLCRMTDNERCAFFNSGTEAVMVAMRLARAATSKNKIVIFEGSYHGTHDSLLAIKKNQITKEAIASIPGISHALVYDTILLSFGHTESLRFIAHHANEIAAVLTEPVRSRHPEEIYPEFLLQLQDICAHKKICFILDEVITGFRIANGGAKSVFGLDPDISIYGKVLGGGLPIGVVAGKKKYLDYIDGGNWSFSNDTVPISPSTFVAGTFCHHPLAMATSKATLELLAEKKNELQDGLNERTKAFCESVNAFCEQLNAPVRLASFGSLFRFLVKGKNKIFYPALLKEKIYVWEGRTCFLSLAHGEKEINHLKEIIRKCIVEMCSTGYFPQKSQTPRMVEPPLLLQTGIEVEGLLNPGIVHLAFNYVCQNINAVNGVNLSTRFCNDAEAPGDDQGQRDCNEHDVDVCLHLSPANGKTTLIFQFSKRYFDGWSVILFVRFLSDCLFALENDQPLPLCRFIAKSSFDSSLNADSIETPAPPLFDATTRYWELPLVYSNFNGTLFEYLLTCFAIALGNGKHVIAVPVSGQLISRNPGIVGNCSCQVPVSLTVSDNVSVKSLINEVQKQLKNAKNNFRHWYSRRNKDCFPVVFNLDNPGDTLLVANKKARLINVADHKTCHNIVCNITPYNERLHISIKFKANYPSEKIEDIATHFFSLLKHGSVFAYSK